jgi:selenocysteine lyase/cysteine desulfurase
MQTPHEQHFDKFRKTLVPYQIIDSTTKLPGLYADYTATGRPDSVVRTTLEKIENTIGNTHSDSLAGEIASAIYERSHQAVLESVNGNSNDIVLFRGDGMTGAINWLQRKLGLHGPNSLDRELTPLVVVTGMEHHSNHISWKENGAEVAMIKMDSQGLPDLNHLKDICSRSRSRTRPLIGAFIAASNVTGVRTPYHEMAKIIHAAGGKVVIDCAASAPYDKINMHPDPNDPSSDLDAVVFSSHKLSGGIGGPGVIVLSKSFIGLTKFTELTKPVDIGGGIVHWVHANGESSITSELPRREEAGSPSVRGAAQAALALELKRQMNPDFIHEREDFFIHTAINDLQSIPGINILEAHNTNRLGIISFTLDQTDPFLIVRLLSDKFGIQVRGGCSCAGPYGHYLLNIDDATSQKIRNEVDNGDNTNRPGWVRVSFHPTMLLSEILRITSAIRETANEYNNWKNEYDFEPKSRSWTLKTRKLNYDELAKSILSL